ncbi:uncharacterized protein LOC120527313 [Polypterus senegalus]|uniref:uncharacterized protein LOC120527313 n=1 Tax=Polypterus senegalus TaxID=55291 RepID=UPI001964D413|nr:uncharacterized protein LOC120527313 [Polypterus senegalus]
MASIRWSNAPKIPLSEEHQPFTARTMKKLNAEVIYETDSPRTHNLKSLRAKRLAYFSQEKKCSDSSKNKATLTSVKAISDESSSHQEKSSTHVVSVMPVVLDQAVKENTSSVSNITTTTTNLPPSATLNNSVELNYEVLDDRSVPEYEKLKHVLEWAQHFIKDPESRENEATFQKSSLCEVKDSDTVFRKYDPHDVLTDGVKTPTAFVIKNCLNSPRLHSQKNYNVLITDSHPDTFKSDNKGNKKPAYSCTESETLHDFINDEYDCISKGAYSMSSKNEVFAGSHNFLDCQQYSANPRCTDEMSHTELFKSTENGKLKNNHSSNIFSVIEDRDKRDIHATHAPKGTYFWHPLDEESDEEYQSQFSKCKTTPYSSYNRDSTEFSEKFYGRGETVHTKSMENWLRSADGPQQQISYLTDNSSRLKNRCYAWEIKENKTSTSDMYFSDGLNDRRSCEVAQSGGGEYIFNTTLERKLNTIPGINSSTLENEEKLEADLPETNTVRTFTLSSKSQENEREHVFQRTPVTDLFIGQIQDFKIRGEQEEIFQSSQHQHTNKNDKFDAYGFCNECFSSNNLYSKWCITCGSELVGTTPQILQRNDRAATHFKLADMNESVKSQISIPSQIKTDSIELNTSQDVAPNSNCNSDQDSVVSVYDKYLLYTKHLDLMRHQRDVGKFGSSYKQLHEDEKRFGEDDDFMKFWDPHAEKKTGSIELCDSVKAKKFQNHNDVDFDSDTELHMSKERSQLSSPDPSVVWKEPSVPPANQASVSHISKPQKKVHRSTLHTFRKGNETEMVTESMQTRSTYQDLKPKKSKNIQTSLIGRKRHWEKSSTAWSSYVHGELKQRSNHLNRPLSAQHCRRTTNEHIPQQRPFSKDSTEFNSFTRQAIKRPSSAGSKESSRKESANSKLYMKSCDTIWSNTGHLCTNSSKDEKQLPDLKQDNQEDLWLCLPDELWIHVFSLLSHKDLCQSAQVCHRFQRLVDDRMLWEVIHIENSASLNDRLLANIGRHCPRILSLYRCHNEMQTITDRGLDELFKQCTDSLKELNITSCSGPGFNGDSILVHASMYCPHITSVDISWTGATDKGIMAIIQSCKCLENLSVNGCQMRDETLSTLVKKHGASLHKLEIFGCHTLSERSLCFMANECSNLKTLNIGRIPKLTEMGLTKMMGCFKNLTSLNVTGLNVIKDCVVHHIAKQCHKLENLTLSSCPYVTDVSLVEIGTYLSSIRHLDVSGCKKVTDTGVQALAKGCHQLRYLDLSSTGTGKQGICLLASYCSRNLECVKVSFCKDVTEDAINKLCKNCNRLKLIHLYGCRSIQNINNIQQANRNVEVHSDLSVNTSQVILK